MLITHTFESGTETFLREPQERMKPDQAVTMEQRPDHCEEVSRWTQDSPKDWSRTSWPELLAQPANLLPRKGLAIAQESRAEAPDVEQSTELCSLPSRATKKQLSVAVDTRSVLRVCHIRFKLLP